MSDATIERPAGKPVPPVSWRWRALDALDERLGLKALQYPIPEQANTLAYSLGGLAACVSAPWPAAWSAHTPIRRTGHLGGDHGSQRSSGGISPPRASAFLS